MSEHHGQYLRESYLPTVWCPGCGNGVIVKSITEAMQDVGWDRDGTVVVGGIGCSGRTPFYLDVNTMHTTHGRALAFATGVKMARPRFNVVVTMGDGDASGIGGNHFIHACRRNIDLTAIVFDNSIYGQTGGQLAPTTPTGKVSTTSPNGSVDPSFDLCKLAEGAGAGFVARTSTFDFQELQSLLKRAFQHQGFALVEVMTACPTYYGRMNGVRDPYAMLREIQEITQGTNGHANGNGDGEPVDMNARPTGVFVDEARDEYTDIYRRRCEEASSG